MFQSVANLFHDNDVLATTSSIFADLSAGWILAAFIKPETKTLTQGVLLSILCLYISVNLRKKAYGHK